MRIRLGESLNLIQIYVGYIGAGSAFGLHLEVFDNALFLTTQGVTMYWGHKHRWSRKWLRKRPAVATAAVAVDTAEAASAAAAASAKSTTHAMAANEPAVDAARVADEATAAAATRARVLSVVPHNTYGPADSGRKLAGSRRSVTSEEDRVPDEPAKAKRAHAMMR